MGVEVPWLDIISDGRWATLNRDQKEKVRNVWLDDYVFKNPYTEEHKKRGRADWFKERTEHQLEDGFDIGEDEEEGWQPYAKAFGSGVLKGLTAGWYAGGNKENLYKTEEEKVVMESLGMPTEKYWGWVDEGEDHPWVDLGGELLGFAVPLGLLSKALYIPKGLMVGAQIAGKYRIPLEGAALAKRMAGLGVKGVQLGAAYGLAHKPRGPEWEHLESPLHAPWTDEEWLRQKAHDILFSAGIFGIGDAFLGSLGPIVRHLKGGELNKVYGQLAKATNILKKKTGVSYDEAASQTVKVLIESIEKLPEVARELPLEQLKQIGLSGQYIRQIASAAKKAGAPLRRITGKKAMAAAEAQLKELGVEAKLVGQDASQSTLFEKLRKQYPNKTESQIYAEAIRLREAGEGAYKKAFGEEAYPVYEMFHKEKALGLSRANQESPADLLARAKKLLEEGIGEIPTGEEGKALRRLLDQSALVGDDLIKMNRRVVQVAKNPNLAPNIKESLYELHYTLWKGKEFLRLLGTGQRDLLTMGDLALLKWQTTIAQGYYQGLKASEVTKSIFGKAGLGEAARERIFWMMNKDWKNLPAFFRKQGLGKPTSVEWELGKWMRREFDDMFEMMQQAGIPFEYRKNYLPLIWKEDPAAIRRYGSATEDIWANAEVARRTGLGSKFAFAKERTLELEQGIAQGLTPIKDPILLMKAYQAAAYRTLANSNLVKTLELINIPYDGKLVPIIAAKMKQLPGKANMDWVPLDIKGLPQIKVAPTFHKELKEIFDPTTRPWEWKWYRGYSKMRNWIKRVIMLNPLIHGVNILSDVLNEAMSWNPITWPIGVVRGIKVFTRGGQIWKARDKIMERFVMAGGDLQGLAQTGNELFEHMGQAIIQEIPNKSNILWRSIVGLKNKSDQFLWRQIVGNGQLGLFERTGDVLRGKFPEMTSEAIDRASAHYVNDLLGTLPRNIFTTTSREVLSSMLFARNWTVSNLRLISGMLGISKRAGVVSGEGLFSIPAKIGKVLPGKPEKLVPGFFKHGFLTPDELRMLQPMYSNHVLKGIYLLASSATIFQVMMRTMTNHLKDVGVLDEKLHGPKVDVNIGVFSNPPGHRLDIDTGMLDKEGRPVYFANFLFRYIHDYIKWMFNPPKTFYNKLEPFLKSSIEAMANYSLWRSEKITPPGMAVQWGKKFKELGLPEYAGMGAAHMVNRGKYILTSISPTPREMLPGFGPPGYDKDAWEWIPYAMGTYIRRGLMLDDTSWKTLKQVDKMVFYNDLTKAEKNELFKGMRETGRIRGKLAQKLLHFRQKLNYERDEVDKEIDIMLQNGDLDGALELVKKYGRYTDWDGLLARARKYGWFFDEMRKRTEEAQVKLKREEEKVQGKEYVY